MRTLLHDRLLSDPRVLRLATLLRHALHPPSGRWRIALALCMGAICHAVFAAAVLAMICAMYFGMSRSLGEVGWPWAALANAALVLQFPLGHSLLLTGRGGRLLARLLPGPHGGTLSTTSYAIIASTQLLSLLVFWTPSGIVWWRAEGTLFWWITAAYAGSWLILIKASFDAGAEVQSGALGWMSLMGNVRPVFPDMPVQGLFRVVRQPIYLAFALTLWTVPVWTPDQLVLAVCYTTYCILAPHLKERRFAKRYGLRFERYRDSVPYMVPRPFRRKKWPAWRQAGATFSSWITVFRNGDPLSASARSFFEPCHFCRVDIGNAHLEDVGHARVAKATHTCQWPCLAV